MHSYYKPIRSLKRKFYSECFVNFTLNPFKNKLSCNNVSNTILYLYKLNFNPLHYLVIFTALSVRIRYFLFRIFLYSVWMRKNAWKKSRSVPVAEKHYNANRITEYIYRWLKWIKAFYSKVFEGNRAGIYFFKVNNVNTRTMCEIYTKLTIKPSKRHHVQIVLVFPLLTLNKLMQVGNIPACKLSVADFPNGADCQY